MRRILLAVLRSFANGEVWYVQTELLTFSAFLVVLRRMGGSGFVCSSGTNKEPRMTLELMSYVSGCVG